MDTHLLVFLYFVYPLLAATLASPGSHFQCELLRVCVEPLASGSAIVYVCVVKAAVPLRGLFVESMAGGP